MLIFCIVIIVVVAAVVVVVVVLLILIIQALIHVALSQQLKSRRGKRRDWQYRDLKVS